jgi:hypothetical protein
MGTKTQIHLTMSFLSVPSDSDVTGTVLANARCFTNIDGMRSWVLPAHEWRKVRPSFDSWSKSWMRMTTIDEVDSMGYEGRNPGPGGAAINLSSQVKGGGFDLLLNAVYSGPSSATPNPTNTVAQQPAQIVITNLAVACRAIVPNGGMLILDGHKDLPDIPTHGTYWLIISPVAVDAAGNSKKM